MTEMDSIEMIGIQKGSKFPDIARLLHHKNKNDWGYVNFFKEYHKDELHQIRGRVIHFQFWYLNYDSYKINVDFEGEHIKYL